jgi:hypothetical protein
VTTYHMTDQDKAVSHREMRKRLYFNLNLITSLDASDQECAAALRTIPNIDQRNVLRNAVWNDGVWAALRVLENNP